MFKRKRSADDFAAEIKAHLELEADELKREGLSDEEARRKARIEFGNLPAAQERFYLRSRAVWLDNLLRDVRYGLRGLWRNPGFTTVAVLTLALAIGANTSIFSLLDQALLRAPCAESRRIGCSQLRWWDFRPRPCRWWKHSGTSP